MSSLKRSAAAAACNQQPEAKRIVTTVSKLAYTCSDCSAKVTDLNTMECIGAVMEKTCNACHRSGYDEAEDCDCPTFNRLESKSCTPVFKSYECEHCEDLVEKEVNRKATHMQYCGPCSMGEDLPHCASCTETKSHKEMAEREDDQDPLCHDCLASREEDEEEEGEEETWKCHECKVYKVEADMDTLGAALYCLCNKCKDSADSTAAAASK